MSAVPDTLEHEERLLSRSRALRLLRETAAESEWEIRAIESLQVVKRWPARRLTVRYVVDARRAGERARSLTLYGKLYRSRRGEQSHAILKALHAQIGLGLAIPAPLGYLARRRFLLMRGLEGESLAVLGRGPGAAGRYALAGLGLARLHGLRSERGQSWPLHDAAAEVEVLARAAERVAAGSLSPSLKQAHGAACAATIAALMQAPAAGQSILHRDLYPAQIVLGSGWVGFIDLDEVACGEAELDLGNLLAHLELIALQGEGLSGPEAALAGEFLRAYAGLRPYAAARLGAYRAAALLRLASLDRLADPGQSVLPWEPLAAALVCLATAGAPR